MKSPFTGKVMPLKKQTRALAFRKEKIDILYHYYLCKDSNEQFTTPELDELNLFQLYNLYREKHNIPFPDEIRNIRKRYGLSASKMSKVLGFGANIYRNYESGEVPSESNAKLIQLAKKPKEFLSLVKLNSDLKAKEIESLIAKLDHLIQISKKDYFREKLEELYLGSNRPSRFTGFVKPNFPKLAEMIVFFAGKCKPWKTKLNKLLFYADFGHFKNYGFSISGANYRAIDMGPVVNNYNSTFEYIAENDFVDIQCIEFDHGVYGEQFMSNSNKSFNKDLFSETELNILEEVNNRFTDVSTSDIIEISHAEEVWKQNFSNGKNVISYLESFNLNEF